MSDKGPAPGERPRKKASAGSAKSSHRPERRSPAHLARRATVLLSAIAVLLVMILLLIPPPSQPEFPPGEGEVADGQAADGQAADGDDRAPPAETEPTPVGPGRPVDPIAPPDTRTDPPPGGGRRPVLAVVIDDAGYNLQGLRPFLELDLPLTIAVLPKLAYSEGSARLSGESAKEVILHLPLEAIGGGDPGPGTIRTSDDDETVMRLVRENLASVPGASGVNNHMGSAATQDERVMGLVLDVLREEGLYFLDSKTTAASVAGRIAGALGLPFAERHVFLDNERDAQSMRRAIREGAELARKNGYAVLIGHVWSDLLPGVLAEEAALLREEGFDFAPLSDILAIRHARSRN